MQAADTGTTSQQDNLPETSPVLKPAQSDHQHMGVCATRLHLNRSPLCLPPRWPLQPQHMHRISADSKWMLAPYSIKPNA